MLRSIVFSVIAVTTAHSTCAETLRVPQGYRTIQDAIDRAKGEDIILVAPGRYSERIRLKPGISLRSEGGNAKGNQGLQRAEATVLDGGNQEDAPGVLMAEDSTLDGFTVTNVGTYVDAQWQEHFESKGEELGDDEGSVHAEGTTPAISIRGVNCTVTNCIVQHNGDVGIGVLGQKKTKTAPLIADNVVYRNMGGGIGVAEGAEPIIRGNTCKENLRAGIGCRKANPIITDNLCFQNIRAGIGCREGARPVMRGNKCYQNRRAGIGIRMEGTAPVVEGNECFENAMAGIGCREGAKPLIVDNECRQNERAGIGVEKQADAIIQGNKCLDNKLVAIGVTGASSATIIDNELTRNGGVPPMIALKEGSTATISDNRIMGGGVAAILIQGRATINGNVFTGKGTKQGNAIWVWKNSTATISDNSFTGYQTAVTAKKTNVTIFGNQVNQFQATAFVIKDSNEPAHIYGNSAISSDPNARVFDLSGPSGIVTENVIQSESRSENKDDICW